MMKRFSLLLPLLLLPLLASGAANTNILNASYNRTNGMFVLPTNAGFGSLSVSNFTDKLNVKYWGAVGDGSTDDYLAVQSALTAAAARGGGTVYVPLGVYKLTNSVFCGSNIRLVGDGPGSVLYNAKTNDYTFIAQDFTNVVIESVAFRGAGRFHDSSAGRASLYLSNGSRASVRNVWVFSSGVCGIGMVGCTNIGISDSFIYGAGEHGIYAAMSYDVIIASVTVKTNQSGAGVKLYACVNASVVTSTMETTENAGILFEAATNCAVIDSMINNGMQPGVRLNTNSLGCSVINCIITHATGDGVLDSGARYSTIRNNTITRGVGKAINISSSSVLPLVAYNFINQTNAEAAITVKTQSVITANMVIGTATALSIESTAVGSKVSGNQFLSTTDIADSGTGSMFSGQLYAGNTIFNGKVGISPSGGTVTPGTTLDIRGDTGGLRVANASGGSTLFAADVDAYSFGIGRGIYGSQTIVLGIAQITLFINADGNVGLGTINPACSFDCTGQVRAASSIFTNSVASYSSNGLAAATITIGASPVLWTNTTAKNVVVYADGISVTGTVGINGGTVFNTIGQNTIILQPGEYTTITFTIGTPTARWRPF